MGARYSRRRRSGNNGGRTWSVAGETDPAATIARHRTGVGPKAVPPGTEGAVQCPDCGVWVKAIQCGRPTAHAAGGWKSSTMTGHPPCPSSGQTF